MSGVLAGWAWDGVPLLDVASRSAQADGVILLAAVGLIGLLFAALALIADWMDRRAWRRDIARAHRENGRGRETAFDDLSDDEFDAYMKATQ